MSTSSLTATVSILCLIVDNTVACGGGGGGGAQYDEPEVANDTHTNTYGHLPSNLEDPSKWSDHWNPSPGLTVQDYNTWMKNYKVITLNYDISVARNHDTQIAHKLAKKQKEKDKNAFNAAGGKWPEKPHDAGADWPENWKGLGPGSGGVPPPPWAFVNESSGKSDLCFLSPTRGPCQKYEVRWGFNPYIDDCAEFVYGGCEGNANNFWSKRRCIDACVGVPTGNCAKGNSTQLNLNHFNFDDMIPARHRRPTQKP